MCQDNYISINTKPIELMHIKIEIKDLIRAAILTNEKLDKLNNLSQKIQILKIMDFRVLSGMMGEIFAKELTIVQNKLKKNPYLNGYPDLLECSSTELINYFQNASAEEFNKYKFGGIEVKNSFGSKKAKTNIQKGDNRINYIKKNLEWKAHHRETNNLLGIFSDFINGVPKIIALFYCNELSASDWAEVQKPKGNSKMTSFSVLLPSGYQKMLKNLKICFNKKEYKDFFSLDIKNT